MVGALCGAGTVAQANEQSGDERVQSAVSRNEGVWEPVVTARDCQTQAPLFTFLSMVSYIRGGNLVLEAASEPSQRATGLGVWRHVGHRSDERLSVLHLRSGRHAIRAPQIVKPHQTECGWPVVPLVGYRRGL